jgi:hypothetical protein
VLLGIVSTFWLRPLIAAGYWMLDLLLSPLNFLLT